nr:PREDICTED: mucin-6 [Lepisosteus oculatus]
MFLCCDRALFCPVGEVGVCSTWGFGHFHTFDNFMYDFSGTCNYILASDCRSLTPAFNVQMRRDALGSIQCIVIELPSSTVRVNREGITLDGRNIPLPFFSEGVLIRTFGILVRLEVKPINLIVMWNREDYLTVEVGENFQNRTCGLCGDFNGDPLKSEFEGNLIPFQFANEQQEDDPNEACLPLESSCSSGIICIEYAYLCKELLDKVALHCPVDKELYVIRCQQDLCLGPEKGQVQSSCSTLTEYARVCARIAPETVSRWRTASLCTVGHCPENQVYLETGSPCRQTCSRPRFRCPAVYNPGCFCPNGTVLDNISEKSRCVQLEECPCVNNGHKYRAGQRRESRCESCVCLNSRWECKERFCPHTCAVEGGSHVTSFDSHKYRFHGSCTYVLLKSALLPWGGMVMGHFHKCGAGERQSCLTAVSFASTQATFSLDRHGVQVENQKVQHLPLRTEHFVIFNQSSSFLQVDMWPWLTLQLQLQPVLSVYLRAEKKLFGLTKGLCGNFNDNSRDDFKNSMGIREGIASRFVHSWRLRSRCASPRNTDPDPCRWSEADDGSLLQRPAPAAEYASTHCRALLNKSSVFGQCHGEVNPLSYFKRCLYEVCNYEETQDYLCGALQSYSRACAEKGMVLKNWWNETVHCAVTCPQNQEFMQNGSLCGRTCRSLSPGATCSPSPVLLEGCSCPPGTYLDQLGSCVPPASCPCFEDNRYFPAGSAVQLDGLTCLCSSGVLDCEGSRGLLPQGEEQDDLSSLCTPPKIFHSCVNETQKACEPTCQDLRIGAICMTCESECFCPNGQYEDELLGCVAPEDCSCQQGETFYQANTVLQTECQSCTCRAGRWDCVMRSVCPGTCVQYGEGHFRTFDDRRFVFDGSCAYTLLQDTCDGADQGRFSLESKVVLCETLGPTCSRAVRLTVGDVSIELAGETYTITPPSASANFTVHDNSLYLVVTATIPYSSNKLVLIWNRNMNLIVKLMKSTQMSLCGLCGNFNGKASDDFRLRSGDLTSDAVAFANSWRTDPGCPLVQEQPSPCDTNPQRRAWAHRKCDIIRSPVFEPCHAQVYYLPFYDACVRDACGCALGGDCKCVCNAVAMYAKECLDQGVCVDWRRPDFCPVYCEFYNSHQLAGASYHYTGNGSCSWHYQPCLCPFQTQGLSSTQNLEGCYSCPTDQYFSVDLQQCAACGHQK